MPRSRHPDRSSQHRLGELRELMALIHEAASRAAAVSAALAWICRSFGARDGHFLHSAEAPAQPVFAGRQWHIPAHVGKRLVGGLELNFDTAQTPSNSDEDFLRLCAEILVWVDKQADAERQAAETTRRFLQLEEAEKRRIGRDLHDNSAQQLAVVRLQMEMLQMSPKDGDELFSQLAAMREVTEQTIADVRRLIADLSPSVLEQLGLIAAIRQLANRFAAEFPCQIQVLPGPPLTIDSDGQLTIYRLVQSAFRFLTENLQATHLNLSLTHAEGVLGLTLEATVASHHLRLTGDSLDLRGTNLWDRVTLLGGTLASQYSAVSVAEGYLVLNLQIPDLTTARE